VQATSVGVPPGPVANVNGALTANNTSAATQQATIPGKGIAAELSSFEMGSALRAQVPGWIPFCPHMQFA
jgi:hypothetical protein